MHDVMSLPVMEDVRLPRATGRAEPGVRPPRLSLASAGPWCVAAVAGLLALVLYKGFSTHARDLWHGIEHDRTAHYEFGLNVAMDIRHGNVRGLLHHLDGARVWGPLHGILVALVELPFGPDYRLGVLPSLVSWAAAAVLGFLVTRRLIPHGGDLAGLLAASFILLSPAHRAFATDIMLESMGAALSLLCLWRYLIAVQEDGPRRGLWLGLALTALFLTKANYWLLVVIGLTTGEFLRQPGLVRAGLFRLKASFGKGGWVLRQARSVWSYLVLLLAVLSLIIVLGGGSGLNLGAVAISVNRPHNLIHLAYAIVFVRTLVWWRRNRVGKQLAAQDAVPRELIYWHVWPVAVYFMLPKRLGFFLWFVGPANSETAASSMSLLRGILYYFQALAQDYHVFACSLVVMLCCVAIGLVTVRRWRPGALTVFCFFALAALATCQHPMLKSRFVHSWAALIWVLGSAGLVHVLCLALRWSPRLPGFAAGALCMVFAALHSSHWLAAGHAPEGGPRSESASTLKIAEAYLPALERSQNPTLLCNVYSPFFLSWTYQETWDRQRFATEVKGFSSQSADTEALAAWTRNAASDAIVLVEIAEDSPYFVRTPTNLDIAAARQFFECGETGYRLTARWQMHENVRIEMWEKRE